MSAGIRGCPTCQRGVDPRRCQVGRSTLPTVIVARGRRHKLAVEWERHRLRARLAQLGLSQEYFPYVQGRSPYPGLAGFEEEDAAVFFGRSAQIAEAMARLRLYREDGGCHLFAILGASGSGKSSFLRAGLWPRLRRDRASFFCLPILPPREWRGAGGGLDIGHAVHVGIDSDSALSGTFGRVAIQASTTTETDEQERAAPGGPAHRVMMSVRA